MTVAGEIASFAVTMMDSRRLPELGRDWIFQSEFCWGEAVDMLSPELLRLESARQLLDTFCSFTVSLLEQQCTMVSSRSLAKVRALSTSSAPVRKRATLSVVITRK